MSASKRESEVGEGGSRNFLGAKNFFSSLSGMTNSMNDDEYCEQEFYDEPNRVTRYENTQ